MLAEMPPSASSTQILECETQFKNNKNSNKINNYSFYECVRPVLLSCKWIGFLPLENLENSKSNDVRFNWKSFYMPIFVSNLLCITFYLLIEFYDNLAYGLDRREISEIIFYMNTILSLIFVIKLAMTWKETLSKIEAVEKDLPFLKNSKANKITIWILVIVLLNASLEFLMYVAHKAYIAERRAKRNGPEYCFRYLFTPTFHWFLDDMPYHCVVGFMLIVSKWQAVSLRNLTDVLVISLTLYLSSRFEHFYRLLLQEEKKQYKRFGGMPWSDIQKHYTKLTRLVMLLDEFINPFILISYTCNLLFICKQIFILIQTQQKNNITASHKSSEEMISIVDWLPIIYLSFSTVFAIVRAALLSLLLAQHHTLTREPLNLLHTVPASVYNYKMQRFMDQVFYSNLSLSGFKFFYITRGSILTMIASLIKYELVLLQFPER